MRITSVNKAPERLSARKFVKTQAPAEMTSAEKTKLIVAGTAVALVAGMAAIVFTRRRPGGA